MRITRLIYEAVRAGLAASQAFFISLYKAIFTIICLHFSMIQHIKVFVVNVFIWCKNQIQFKLTRKETICLQLIS